MWYRLRGLDEPTPEDADSVPDSEKLTKGRPSSDRYGSDEEDGQAVLLPVRRVAEELNWLENFRGFILFGLFFACYFALNTVRLDWWTGHETIKMLEASRDGLKIPALVDTGSLKDANTYLVHGLPEIVVSLKENRCLNCKVGITPINHDMNHLSMGQFICSDFLSIADSDEYPSRDCPAADAAFALNPSATEETTPCCSDATLVRASVAAMAAVGTSVEVPETLEELLGGVDELTSQLLEKHIDESGVLYQVIVSRELRMAGIQYYATWDDKVNAPGRITPKSQFWSYSYDHDVAKDYMLVLVLAFGILSLMHEIVQPWTENVESIRAYVLNPFMLLVEIPTIVLPPLIELLKKEIDISEYTIFVTLLELLLVIRLFEEGEIVPPLRLFVSVLNHAGSMLLKFVVVLFPMIFITAAAQSQLFGPFDDGYADYATSVSRIVRVLTAPPSTEGPIFEHTNLGAQLMYYWRARHAQKSPRPAARPCGHSPLQSPATGPVAHGRRLPHTCGAAGAITHGCRLPHARLQVHLRAAPRLRVLPCRHPRGRIQQGHRLARRGQGQHEAAARLHARRAPGALLQLRPACRQLLPDVARARRLGLAADPHAQGRRGRGAGAACPAPAPRPRAARAHDRMRPSQRSRAPGPATVGGRGAGPAGV